MKPTPAGAMVIHLTRGHLVQLDGLRGLAILLVIAYHFCLPHADSRGSQPALALQLAQCGWIGVDLFFVLSGFLITGILIETRDQAHYFRNFMGRRFLRIWPLYYLSLLMLLVVLPLVMPSVPVELQSMREKQVWFWLYSANWLFALEGGFVHTSGGYFWSLAVEEQFYLAWPFVVYALSTRTLLRTSVAMLVFSLAARIVLVNVSVNPQLLYTMTFTHLDGLAVGSVLAICLRSPVAAARLIRLVPGVVIVAAVGLVAVRLADGNLHFWSKNTATYGYTLIVVLFGALLIAVVRTREESAVLTRIFSSRFMTLSGKYSYALYVVHVPVASLLYPLVVRALKPIEPAIGYESVFLMFALLSFVLSWAIAVASWYLFEKPILSLKRYFTYENESRPAEAVRSAAHTLPD